VLRARYLLVVAACLATADELHTLDLDLLRVGLSFERRRDLGRELFEPHRELAVFLAGKAAPCGPMAVRARRP
jgi:hypothetical protein